MEKHVLKIENNSEAENYFVNELMPHCKDGVICRLGSIFGRPYNEYEFTHDDYIRIQNYIEQRDN